MKQEIKEKELKLENSDEENISICYTRYTLNWKDEEEIIVTRTQRYSDLVGEQDDDFEFEFDRDLTDKEEEEIKNFIWNLK